MSSLADLKDKRIGVLLGSVHDGLAHKNYPTATILQYESSPDLALAVMAGKVDAALSDAEPLAELMRANPELGVLGDPLISSPDWRGFPRKGQHRAQGRLQHVPGRDHAERRACLHG